MMAIRSEFGGGEGVAKQRGVVVVEEEEKELRVKSKGGFFVGEFGSFKMRL